MKSHVSSGSGFFIQGQSTGRCEGELLDRGSQHLNIHPEAGERGPFSLTPNVYRSSSGPLSPDVLAHIVV